MGEELNCTEEFKTLARHRRRYVEVVVVHSAPLDRGVGCVDGQEIPLGPGPFPSRGPSLRERERSSPA